MIRKPRKPRKDRSAFYDNQEDYQFIRTGTQNYLGRNVAIPKGSFWFKDEKKKKAEEEQKESQDLKKVAKADDFAIREILSDNDTVLSKEAFSSNKNFMRPVTTPVKHGRKKKEMLDATTKTVTKLKKPRKPYTRKPKLS